ncbi:MULTISPECIES: DNA-directed RNA polymerase subunit alpha C-terminal domain-containing protein [unclassified Mesorhizobium]|uniref:DNA-directed RNA polymerase subunit alpha C-terminal domain-containing protein n=2 Tax=Mesorhizobium TaxID=68287 RepID=UPI000FD9F902|nr:MULTISPECIES: DNA-directed RNA polymerase subunit alpha C-terminal domain-containing protein [unclassified Mesorhizobium]TGT64043.1 hypothetical protein EN809_034875 [Mesorhizobium sp. M2E.F.Ca.ET.166.01.1.1]TGV97073.1 hypothetical protein EN797_035285 [Mesorhizobium sp. M2E.F.Ca.ET.154.01.1.1]
MQSPHSPVDDLELSVRTGNVLRRYGITTIDRFLQLTKPEVMFFRHAGAKTWREIQEVQINLRRNERRQSLPGRAAELLRGLNELGPELAQAGFFIRPDAKGRLRLGRYVTKEDFDEEN